MVIQRNAWSVGSLSSTDPNAQSFHSPNWQHSGGKRSSSQDIVAVEDDAVTIGSHPPYNLQNSAVNVGLVNAISFNQTEDGFLKKAQEALERMSELSMMAQSEAYTEVERLNYTAEFTQLQNCIKEIEKKMFKAINLFQPSKLEDAPEADDARDGSEVASSLRQMQSNAYLESSSNPEVTAINSAKSASAAANTILNALEAVADLRAKVSTDLQRLNLTGEQLSAMDISPSRADLQIRDVNVAEESTRFARHDILLKSGTAMLAQANALPQSALRLLG